MSGPYTTTPHTFIPGETPGAAIWNGHLTAFANAFGTWSTYAPTFGTAITPGNGISQGWYIQIQKLVIYRVLFTFGSTSAAGAGVVSYTLPVTANSNVVGQETSGLFTITNRYTAAGWFNSTTIAYLAMSGTNGLVTNISSSLPNTWATGSTIQSVGLYEAA